jgi:hypothetical protein
MQSATLDEIYAPLIKRGLKVDQFTVTVGDFRQPAVIVSPPADKLASNPVLLLAIEGSTALIGPNQLPAEYFWKHGHRVVTFPVGDMPGDLNLLPGMVLKGPDPFKQFIEIAEAVLKHCIDEGWAKPDRIVVTGISRYGYLALRLMAADDRLKIGGGFSPVTDWRVLTEFAGQRDMKQIADLRLSLLADQLAGKHIYMAIGNHDERVGTLSACQFFLDLNAANKKRGFGQDLVDFYLTPDIDHRCGDEWYQRGMKFLLDNALAQDK